LKKFPSRDRKNFEKKNPGSVNKDKLSGFFYIQIPNEKILKKFPSRDRKNFEKKNPGSVNKDKLSGFCNKKEGSKNFNMKIYKSSLSNRQDKTIYSKYLKLD